MKKALVASRDGRTDPATLVLGAEVSAKTQIKEYKEQLILSAAANLFYEKGFQKTTLDEIAAALNMTKPFIYTYFKSKDALLEALFDMVYSDFFGKAYAALNSRLGSPRARLEAFMDVFVRSNIQQHKITGILLEEEKNLSADRIAEIRRQQHEFDQRLTQLISEGVEVGEFNVADAAVCSLAISGMVRWTHRWYRRSGRLSEEELCAHMRGLALRLVGWSDPSTLTRTRGRPLRRTFPDRGHL
ncbi:TetR/AcrR family transcriptional regulator [Ramlibacter henchirensis]|nr:TetR/AcrR family transcriptional regulator [Ramlibacter henchirensis]